MDFADIGCVGLDRRWDVRAWVRIIHQRCAVRRPLSGAERKCSVYVSRDPSRSWSSSSQAAPLTVVTGIDTAG